MNIAKIGKFISDRRKSKKLTQEKLAEELNISDRAISKWERGICLPDVSTMIPLCKILDISVNELLSGEKIDMKDYKEKNESLLLELAKQEELKNKKLMTSMWTILITNAIFYIGILLLSVNILEEGILLGTIICISTIVFVTAGFIALKFEVAAGYYECKKCHHKFIPTYKEVMLATHMGTIRH